MLKDYAGDDRDQDETETRVGHSREDDVDVYIGRHGDGGENDITNTPIGEAGWLGNPFRVEYFDREESVARYCQLLLERVDQDSEFRRALAEDVAGSALGCWCRSVDEDEPLCHGDVVARVADALRGDRERSTSGSS